MSEDEQNTNDASKKKATRRVPLRRLPPSAAKKGLVQTPQADDAPLSESDLVKMLQEPGVDLVAVQRQLAALIRRRQESEVQKFREDTSKRIRDAAARFELPIGELLGSELVTMIKHSQKESAPVIPPKYYNPANPTETWSGRGRQPNWFKTAVEEDGKSPEDMLIESKPAADDKQ